MRALSCSGRPDDAIRNDDVRRLGSERLDHGRTGRAGLERHDPLLPVALVHREDRAVLGGTGPVGPLLGGAVHHPGSGATGSAPRQPARRRRKRYRFASIQRDIRPASRKHSSGIARRFTRAIFSA